MNDREIYIRLLMEDPISYAHMLGFDKLGAMHNEWIRDMVSEGEDKTLQSHRLSYKTTCVSIALAEIIILMPNLRSLFIRKTDADVKEIIKQVQNILMDEHTQHIVEVIHGKPLVLLTANMTSIQTNLTNDIKGTDQLMGMGIGASLTGKHFDRIFTDDIVNINDRVSRAERERTKLIYQELQNVKNKPYGRIYNSGTPWHKEDAFSIMPEPEKHDVYETGILSKKEIEKIKASMLPSLFAANYELRHIASEDVIFENPVIGADPMNVQNGIGHVDAAYGGEDYTAFTLCNKKDGKYYVFGKLWRRHVEDVEDEIISLRKAFLCGKMHVETNADKGYLAKDLRSRGERVVSYNENMNKFIKITTYLKAAWKDVVFVAGTDKEYIDQICDYNENAEHDDAPDSLACAVRLLYNKKEEQYKPLWN